MTDTAKYTPGPWFVGAGETYNVRDAATEGIVAQIHFLRGRHGLAGRITPEQGLANAHLIAAAPNLLKQLKSAMAHIQMLEEGIEELRQLGATAQFCGVNFSHAVAISIIAEAEGR